MMITPNNIPQGYKATTLGIIPQEWKTVRLKDCFSISAGGDVQKNYFSETPSSQYKYPIYSNSLSNHGLYGFTSHPRHKANSITITGRGDLGHAEYRETNFDAIVRLLVLTPKIPLSGRFITEYINFREPFFYESTGVPQLTVPQIASIQVLFPPLAEQKKIAEVLSVWDRAIEKQSQLIEQLTLRKRGLMQQLLTAKRRLPVFSDPWKKVRLGDIGKFDKGFGVPKESIKKNGNKAITYGEIYTKYNYVIKNVASYIDDETASISKKITRGTILFTGSGETLEDIGKCVAFIDNDVAYAGGDIIIFNPSIEINSVVLSYCLNSSPVNAQKWKYGQGFSVVHIYQKDLAKIQIEIPSFEEQTAIAQVLTAADREIELAQQKLELLRQQKRGLMQQLLTGKKRVKL